MLYLRIRHALAIVGWACAPGVAIAILVPLYFGVDLLNFVPVWSDEVGYWREAYTFGHVGFDGGYYTMDEVPAGAGFTHFGAHGPVFAMLLSPIVTLIGWCVSYMPLVNLAFIGMAMIGYCCMSQVTGWRLAFAGLSVLSFWPLILYVPTFMQESTHQALGIALAGFFALLIRRRAEIGTRAYVIGGVLLAIATLLRPTWSFLLIPFLLFRHARVAMRSIVVSALLPLPVMAFSFMLSNWFAAPFPNFISTVAPTAKESKWKAFKLLARHFEANIRALNDGHWLELGVRIALFAILVAATALLGYRLVRRSWRSGDTEGVDLALFHLLNLVPAIAVVMVLYDVGDWRDFRVFAPSLLLSILVSVPFLRPSLAADALASHASVFVPLATSLLLVVSFASGFRMFHEVHYTPVSLRSSPLASAVSVRDTHDPWQNTVLVDLESYNSELTVLPPGIGVSLILDPPRYRNGHHIKSRYLVVSDQTLALMGHPGGLKELGKTRYGKLYLHEG